MQEFKQNKKTSFHVRIKLKSKQIQTHSPTLTHTLKQKHAADLTENEHEILRNPANV